MRVTPLVVAHVTQSLGWGGLEQVVFDLCRGVDPERYQALAVSLSDQVPRREQFEAAGIEVEVVPQHGLDLSLPGRLAELLRRRRVAIVHAHNFGRFFYAGPAARLAGCAACYTEHSQTRPDERALWWTQRALSRLSGPVAAVSDTVREHLVTRQGLPPEQVRVIPNGIDVQRYAAADLDARAALGLPDGVFVVAHVGRFVPVKNHRRLITAFARVRERLPGAVLALAGDGELRANLERLTAELGLVEAVRFLGLRDDVPRVLAAADLVVLSSDSEGLPLALIEAMAAGRPTVATRAAGRDVVRPETGLLVPTEDTKALAEAIIRLAEEPETRQAMGARAAAIAREHYSLAAMARRYQALYDELVGAQPTVPA